MPIALYEDFDSPTGTFTNYDAYDVGQRIALSGQRHVDIRTFEAAIAGPYPMLGLDAATEAALDGLTQTQIESGYLIRPSEGWSFSSAAATNYCPNPSLEHDTLGGIPSGWVANTTGVTLAVASGGVQGTQCLQVTADGNHPEQGAQIPLPAGTTFKAGNRYMVSFYLKGAIGNEGLINAGVLPIAHAFNSAGSNTNLTAAWQRTFAHWHPTRDEVADGTTGANGIVLSAELFLAAPQPATFFIDGILLTDGNTLLAYFDGDTGQWLGPPGASFSTSIPSSPGSTGPQGDRNNFNGMTLACFPGLNTATSVMTERVDVSNLITDGQVSLPLLFTSSPDYLSLALPNFPVPALDLTQTFLDLTSNSAGDFTAGPTNSIPFSSASLISTFAGFGNDPDYEARLPLGYLRTVDKTQITGVRLRVQAIVGCTFRCLGIRAMAGTWKYAPIDQNTLYDRLQATIPPTGSLAQTHTFPTSSGTPADWPILFRADPLSADPTPIDLEIGAVVHTGTSAASNHFSLYLRETPTVPCQQSDLDGQSMTQLDGIGEQPDAAPPAAEFTPDTMSDLDALRISTLDTDTVGELERGHRAGDSRYLLVTLNWGLSASVTVTDQLGANSYPFPLALAAHSDYYLRASLYGSSLRVQIYPLSVEGYIDWSTPTFDSTAIIDPGLAIRRKGRFGWDAQLGDGDTYVTRLRPRYVVHNEYRSLPLTSETPVEGAQLFVGASPDRDLYTGATSTTGAPLSLDVTKSTSGHCLRVYCDGTTGQQGIMTSLMRFENLSESRIEFDLLTPAGVRLLGYLAGEFRFIPLNLPPVSSNQWQHITLALDGLGSLYQPGPYRFKLFQSHPVQATWYVDNLSIQTRALAWAGRQAADPWKMNNPSWVPFNDTVNQPYDGIGFDRGTQLQIRGRGLTQDATIEHLQILPRYSTLGNFTWSDQQPVYASPPVASFSVGTAGLAVILDASASTAAAGIAAYYWTFGNGEVGYGRTVTYTYATHGTYTVTLTVIDTQTQKVSLSQAVVM